MKHALRILALGHSKYIDISAEEFEAIKVAREQLRVFGTFTENYRIVLESYHRLETVKHEIELNNLLYGFGFYGGLLDIRVALNSAIMAYLATARYFLDSGDKMLTKLIGAQAFAAFEAFRANIYDTQKEYKFVEGLRNYVQHRAVPVDNMKFYNFVEDTKNHETSDIVTAVSLLVNRDSLQNDEKFKKGALVNMPDAIDIIQCTRVHMGGMWALHDYIISNHGALAATARKVISDQIDRFQKEVGGSVVGLHAVAYSDGKEITEQAPVLLKWDDARLDALKKIGNLKNLHKWYISGKIQASRK